MDEIKIETIDKKSEKEEELADSDDSRTVTNCSKRIKLDDSARQSNQPAQQQAQTQQQQQAHRQFPEVHRSLQSGIPANYCTYCNKELCNKYFMKTHMQKMHGINLDDCPREAANSGGVVCDICQKELCSKYFLKVHKSNTHGITDFTGSSASSQAANAATAVAAIALTNYSLNQVQNRAALNLALNRQLQSRQAAVLMNAAAAAVTHQRDQINASNLIGHLQQQHPPQQLTNNQQQQLGTQQHQHQHQQHIDLHAAQQVSLLPANQRTSAADFQATFPAALLAATAGPTLLAAQLAQQQHLNQQQQQQQQQNSFSLSIDNSHSLSQQLQECQPTHPSIEPAPFSFPTINEDPLDTGDDSSDTDSQNSQDHHKSSSASITTGANNVLQQQALLNAAAVLNPAAAAMIAMQQQQQQQQQQQLQLQQQHQQHQHQQQQRLQQQQQQLSSGSRQPTAIDLRNQPNGQHSHYTEACPICDRRFKSIKWLQSHVMNDHKNEISNLFNLLVQMMLMSGGETGESNGTHNNGNGNSNQAGGSITEARSSSNGVLDIDWQQVVMQQQSQVSSMAAAAAAAGATATTGTSRTGSGGDV